MYKYIFGLLILSAVLGACGGNQEVESASQEELALAPPQFPFGMNLSDAELFFKQINTGSSDCEQHISVIESEGAKLLIDSSFCKGTSMKVNYFYLEKGKLIAYHAKEWTKVYGGDSEFSISEMVSDFKGGNQWALEQGVKKIGAPANIELNWMEGVPEGLKQFEKEVEALDFTKGFSANDSYELYSLNHGINPATNTENYGIYLSTKACRDQLFLAEELAFSESVDRKAKGVPNDAVFAFDTWFAGGGSVYYGRVKKGRLYVYRKYEDEGTPPETGTEELVRKLDPYALTEIPAYYLVFNENKKREKSILVAFRKDGKALFFEYEGGDRQYPLAFMKDGMTGNSLVTNYKAGGHRSFIHTHSGIWDYLELERVKDGKKLSYTLDLERSQADEGFLVLPPF